MGQYPDRIEMIRDGYVAVSANAILRDRAVNTTTVPELSRPINIEDDSEFAQAFRRVESRIRDRLATSSTAQSLLAMPGWGRSQREAWEANLGQIVSEEMGEEPLFSEYRASGLRLSNFNTLSDQRKFDCSEMSVVEALLMQRVENDDDVLGSINSDRPNDLRRAGDYYVVEGFYADASVSEWHQWHISSITGNVFESTINSGSMPVYYQSMEGSNWSFDRFIAGFPFVGVPASVDEDAMTTTPLMYPEEIAIYNQGYFNNVDFQSARDQRLEAIQSRDYQNLATASLSFTTVDERRQLFEETAEGILQQQRDILNGAGQVAPIQPATEAPAESPAPLIRQNDGRGGR